MSNFLTDLGIRSRFAIQLFSSLIGLALKGISYLCLEFYFFFVRPTYDECVVLRTKNRPDFISA